MSIEGTARVKPGEALSRQDLPARMQRVCLKRVVLQGNTPCQAIVEQIAISNDNNDSDSTI